MITLICGPMFGGKSTTLIQKMERCFYAKQKFAYISPKIDNRGYITHSGLKNLHDKFGDSVDCYEVESLTSIAKTFVDEYDSIFVDEYFMIKDCKSLCTSLPQNKNKKIDIYFGGLLADSDANTWPEAIEILPYCDEIIKLSPICTDCHSQHANYSYFLGGTKKDRIVVGDDAYTCLCRKCYLKRRLQKN